MRIKLNHKCHIPKNCVFKTFVFIYHSLFSSCIAYWKEHKTFSQNKTITKTQVRVLIMTVSLGNSFSEVQFILCRGGIIIPVAPALESQTVYLKILKTWETSKKYVVFSLFRTPVDTGNHFSLTLTVKPSIIVNFCPLSLLTNSSMERFQTLSQRFPHLHKSVKLSP